MLLQNIQKIFNEPLKSETTELQDLQAKIKASFEEVSDYQSLLANKVNNISKVLTFFMMAAMGSMIYYQKDKIKKIYNNHKANRCYIAPEYTPEYGQ